MGFLGLRVGAHTKALASAKQHASAAKQMNRELENQMLDAVLDINQLKSELRSVRESCDQIAQAMRQLRGEEVSSSSSRSLSDSLANDGCAGRDVIEGEFRVCEDQGKLD